MGFAVQQLLGRAVAADRDAGTGQRVEEKLPVGNGEAGGVARARDQPCSLGNPFRDVRRRDSDASHPRMELMQRVGVLGRRNAARGHRLVVGPEGHHEATGVVDAWLDSGLGCRDRARRCSELASEPDLESEDLVLRHSYPREDVARHQAQTELVGVVDHNRVVDTQVQGDGTGRHLGDGPRNDLCLHASILTLVASATVRASARVTVPR